MIKGYKVFNSNWTCLDKQYTCPGKFKEKVNLALCGKGMHFCKKLVNCFNYYIFDPKNKVAEVIAYGNIIETEDKCCTDKLEIVRELSWEEVLERVNTGSNCTGFNNTGNNNNGDRNTGNNNEGHYNTGDYNNGNSNSGDNNNGDNNTGSNNEGHYNTGDYNKGLFNSGDWNKTNFSNGCFNTEEAKILMFNKPSNWTHQDWERSNARYVLISLLENKFLGNVPASKDDSFDTDFKDTNICWHNLTDYEKDAILSLPNFDKEIFKEITGIDVDN